MVTFEQQEPARRRLVGSRYVLDERLGGGALGTAWRATGPDGAVAVKLLRPEYAEDPELVAGFSANGRHCSGSATQTSCGSETWSQTVTSWR